MRNGWVKQYKREVDDMGTLTDQEYRYYQVSRLLADWDKRHLNFGTFNARTQSMKDAGLFEWSSSKINMTKNSLLKKGYYKVVPGHRLAFANPKLLFGKSRDVEHIMQNIEGNPYQVGTDIQPTVNRLKDISEMRAKLANNKRIS